MRARAAFSERRKIVSRPILVLTLIVCTLFTGRATWGQIWKRPTERSAAEPEPGVKSSWKYDLAPSAFQPPSHSAPYNAVRSRSTPERLPQATAPVRSNSQFSKESVQSQQSAATSSEAVRSVGGNSPGVRRSFGGNTVSAPQPRRHSERTNQDPAYQSVPSTGSARPQIRNTNLTQTGDEQSYPIGTLPPLTAFPRSPSFSDQDVSSISGPGQANQGPPNEQWARPEISYPATGSFLADGTGSLSPSVLFWWESDLGGPVLRGRPQMPMSLQEALHRALNEAPELKVLHADWYIQMQEQTRQDAAFDWTTFVDTVWNRDSTPVGSQLDGAAMRLRSRTSSATAGLRRLDRTGGEFEFSQQVGGRESNSQFIDPNNQGNTRLSLKYERPLLRGAGKEYNNGSLQIAQLDKDIAFDRLQAGIQDHLLATSRAYWSLVLARGDFLQKVTSWSRAKAIADEMELRLEVDVTPGALDRAKSEVSSRLAQSIQAEHDVTAAQEILLELIYASRFTEFTHYEVLTTTSPPHHPSGIDVELQADQAVQTRSEVQQAIREIRAASIEYNLAKNEVLPRLDLVLSGYTAGLRPEYDIGQSLIDQFSEGEPGAGVGLNFEIPYGNRAARAAAEQRRIAVTRLQREFEIVVGEVKQDVRQQAIRRNKFASSLPQQWETLVLARKMLDYNQTRRDFLADGVRVGELYLNDLLQIQSRLQNAEFQYLQTQVSFAVADNSLMRSLSTIQTLAEPAWGTGTYSESGNAPGRKQPPHSAPQPQQSVPQQSVPQQSVPQQSVPQQSVPQQSVPQQTGPGDVPPIPRMLRPGENREF